MTAPLLAIRNLAIDYRTPAGPVHAVRGIDLTLEAGQTLGLVGESGSGKSTLVSAMMGLIADNAAISGTLEFEGRDLIGMADAERRRLRGNGIASIFQDPFTALNPVVSVGDFLREVQHHKHALTRDQKRTRSTQMLERVGISDPQQRLRQYPFELSGGMRQRVAIAAALLTEPRLLIADEPTTALDATTEAQIIDLLRRNRTLVGGATVFVTHHLGLVAEFCDVVAVMYAGEIVETGPVRRIFRQPAHPYTRALLACDPAMLPEATRILPTIGGSIPNLVNRPAGCSFAPRCDFAVERCTAAPPPPVEVMAGGWARCLRAVAS
jgi:peptide/nickel transport system ATP-binding protein